MNSKVEGNSWFGNLRRQFESICKDVDEVMNHESIKYIERHVTNVGENVMTFYSNLAETIVTPILDLKPNKAKDQINQPEDNSAQSTVESIAPEPVKNEDFVSSINIQSPVESVVRQPVNSASSSTITFDGNTIDTINWHPDYICSQINSYGNDSLNSSTESSGLSDFDREITCFEKEIKDLSYLPEFEEEDLFHETQRNLSYKDSMNMERNAGENIVKFHSNPLTRIDEDFACSSEIQGSDFPKIDSSEQESDSSSEEENDFETSAIECLSCTSSDSYVSASCTTIPHEDIRCDEKTAEIESNMLPNEDLNVHFESLNSGIDPRNDTPVMSKWYFDYLSTQMDHDSDEIVSHTIISSIESSGSSETSELEENCDIIDYTTLYDASRKKPSLKKKILGALSSKWRLGREYKELSVLHRQSETKHCQGTNLPAADHSETVQISGSQWEFIN